MATRTWKSASSSSPQKRRFNVKALVGVIAVLLGLNLVLVAVLVFRDADDSTVVIADEQVTAEPAAESAVDPLATEVVDAAPADPTVETEPEPVSEPDPVETVIDPEPVPAVEEPTASAPDAQETAGSQPDLERFPTADDLPLHGAVYRGGKLYLEGAVPSTEIRDAFFEEAAAVIGPENVIDNYIIDPRAPIPTDGRVRVDEPIQFETGSAVIAEEFLPILDLGVVVLTINPQATMRVEGHTDDIGSDATNLALSQLRAEAVVAYMAERGIDPSRFVAIGKGESEPVADNATEEGRQTNRRIQVEILDLLAG